MIKNKIGLLKIVATILCSVLFLSGCEDNKIGDLWPDGEDDIACTPDTTPVSFKNVGFWTDATISGDDELTKNIDNLDSINFTGLTHLNYAYIKTDEKGEINPDQTVLDRIEDLRKTVTGKGTKVGVSIGGGSDANFNTIAGNTSLTDTFVKNIAKFLVDNDLDGVDLYWATPDNKEEGKLFEKLVSKISEKMREDKKYFSISVVSGDDKHKEQAKAILQDVFKSVDFINVRALDGQGKDFATLEDSKEAITYWTERCVVKNKIVLAVPFHSTGDVKSFGFIENASSAAACKDKDSSGKHYYNCIPTVVAKTKYVKTHAGGIMSLSLEQDSYDTTAPSQYSLQNAIYQTSKGTNVGACNL